jgi:hypothetical protein
MSACLSGPRQRLVSHPLPLPSRLLILHMRREFGLAGHQLLRGQFLDHRHNIRQQAMWAPPVVVDAAAGAVATAYDEYAGAEAAFEMGSEPAHEAAVIDASREVKREHRTVRPARAAPELGVSERSTSPRHARRRESDPTATEGLIQTTPGIPDPFVHDQIGDGDDPPQPQVGLSLGLLTYINHRPTVDQRQCGPVPSY